MYKLSSIWEVNRYVCSLLSRLSVYPKTCLWTTVFIKQNSLPKLVFETFFCLDSESQEKNQANKGGRVGTDIEVVNRDFNQVRAYVVCMYLCMHVECTYSSFINYFNYLVDTFHWAWWAHWFVRLYKKDCYNKNC
jgi:hypothetical protein